MVRMGLDPHHTLCLSHNTWEEIPAILLSMSGLSELRRVRLSYVPHSVMPLQVSNAANLALHNLIYALVGLRNLTETIGEMLLPNHHSIHRLFQIRVIKIPIGFY